MVINGFLILLFYLLRYANVLEKFRNNIWCLEKFNDKAFAKGLPDLFSTLNNYFQRKSLSTIGFIKLFILSMTLQYNGNPSIGRVFVH